jgi:hypothetical protein
MPNKEDLEKYAKQIQEMILEQARKEYSEVVIEHWQNPRNFRATEQPDGYGKVKGVCGDTMEMFIKVKNGKISECSFLTNGCATTIACGSIEAGFSRQPLSTKIFLEKAVQKNLNPFFPHSPRFTLRDRRQS